ncbi:PREDICTED: uncharacterized protein LOC105537642 [Mandrillus leucophaeus]|uniref:uncharacterized protein LOC105537642 n=1 Tax=Mandrillus leucophaeus TaxID=9568 RepID=UPI0005F46B88|nr:PREDICTED: uncharacterized protein LOC105537642 [Mandrillus leucophaeus]
MAVMVSSFLRVIPGETDGRIEEKREPSKEERRCVSPSHQACRCWVVPKEALRSLELELSRRSFAGTVPIPEHLWPSCFTELAFLSEERGKTACYPGRCGEALSRLGCGFQASAQCPQRASVSPASRPGGRDEEGRRGAASKDVPWDPPHLPVDFLAERMLADPVTCGDTARSALQFLGTPQRRAWPLAVDSLWLGGNVRSGACLFALAWCQHSRQDFAADHAPWSLLPRWRRCPWHLQPW